MNYKSIFKIIVFTVFLGLAFSVILTPVQATKNLKDAFLVDDGNNTDLLDTAASKAGYTAKGGQDAVTPEKVIARIIQMALSFVGVVFLILMIYGGYLWMIDRGNEEAVQKAKKIISASIIGLIIVVAAYAITFLVINQLTKTTLK